MAPKRDEELTELDVIQLVIDKGDALSDKQVKYLHSQKSDIDEDAYDAWMAKREDKTLEQYRKDRDGT
jgi:hypothetical protein